MPRKLAVLTLLALAAAAHASPSQDAAPAHEGMLPRIGHSITHATDRAAELVLAAMNSLGVPYRRGGTSAETGFDCSGFVRAMYEQTMGLILPRRAADQAAATAKIARNELQPGDLVFFNTMRRRFSHVGIYLGEGQFIHAPRTGSQVEITSLDTSYWRARFNGARRVLMNQPAPTDAASFATGGGLPAPLRDNAAAPAAGGANASEPAHQAAGGDDQT